ncbi:MAG: response regulator [Planctomycetes bacterium]|nr:response regulator [Planctomycetota bacterium]
MENNNYDVASKPTYAPMGSGAAKPAVLRTRQQIVVVLRLIIFTVIYLIAFQERKLADLPWLIWLVLGVFVASEIAYLFEHRTSFFIQRVLGWIFLFDAVLITLLIYLLNIKSVELYIAYFTVIAIATMTKNVATSFIVTFLVSIFYLSVPLYQGDFKLTEFLTRPLFFFAVAMFSGYLSEEVWRQRKKKFEAETKIKEIESQLRQAKKMEVVGQLTGGIAHDFNNILADIMGHSELALMDIDPTDPLHKTFNTIYRQAERAAELTRRLLTFSRQQTLNLKNLNVNELIQELVKFIGRTIPENIELRFMPGENINVINADPVAIEQIILNLCVNARDAMPQGGHIVITTTDTAGLIRADRFYPPVEAFAVIANGEQAQVSPYALISITDTGSGMTSEVKQRLFEPFFTTKAKDKGTGLGLAMVYGLVKQHDGQVEVDSAPNKGTTFRIYLPAVVPTQSVGTEAGLPKPETKIIPHGGTRSEGDETILIAEDDPAVLDIARAALEPCGYKIITAANGSAAFNLFCKYTDEIELCILDMVMPGKNGVEVYELVKEIKPEIDILFITGYNVTDRETIPEIFGETIGTDFIQKPFNINGLRQKVRELLDRRRQPNKVWSDV